MISPAIAAAMPPTGSLHASFLKACRPSPPATINRQGPPKPYKRKRAPRGSASWRGIGSCPRRGCIPRPAGAEGIPEEQQVRGCVHTPGWQRQKFAGRIAARRCYGGFFLRRPPGRDCRKAPPASRTRPRSGSPSAAPHRRASSCSPNSRLATASRSSRATGYPRDRAPAHSTRWWPSARPAQWDFRCRVRRFGSSAQTTLTFRTVRPERFWSTDRM